MGEDKMYKYLIRTIQQKIQEGLYWTPTELDRWYKSIIALVESGQPIHRYRIFIVVRHCD